MSKYETLVPLFLDYVKHPTRSDETSSTVPSTAKQTKFLHYLKKQLEQLPLENIRIHEKNSYLLAELPANCANAAAPTLGLLAHVDTADFNDEGVKPQIIKNYDGKSKIKLGDSGLVLDPAEFSSLKKYAGSDLITTDGTTLLGADDKAGVAEIMTLLHYLSAHPEIKHGKIVVGFGPDEEIGTGADHFDVKDFGADLAYTVDGGPLGELEYETFNAAQANITITGKNVHPATAKNIMVNALQVAIDLHNALPKDAVPEKTAGRQGFYHLLSLSGSVDEAKMQYIIRDHDRTKFEAMKDYLEHVVALMNEQFGQPRIKLALFDQYYNMKDALADHMQVVEVAKAAMEQLNIKPDIYPVRGGTDGSKISFMGLPTPNLFAGGENMHGRFEYVAVDVMESAVDVLVKIAEILATKAKSDF